MEHLTIPKLPTIIDEKLSAVSTEELNRIVNYVNGIVDTLKLQRSEMLEMSKRISKLEGDLAKVAGIVEELYETY